MRTGAASGVSTRLLSRPDARVLGLFGAGAQAAWQVRAVMAARQITEVRVFARTVEGREALASSLADELGAAVRVVAAESAEATVRGADVICCATTSFEPIFSAAWVDPGTHISAVGSFQKGMVELPPQLFAAAALVAVDSRAAALEEAGDLLAAIETGRLAADQFVEIGSLDRDWAATRDPAAITVFKSVGLAIQDLATAELVMANLGRAAAEAG
jgi:ornithine cyclodeaminase